MKRRFFMGSVAAALAGFALEPGKTFFLAPEGGWITSGAEATQLYGKIRMNSFHSVPRGTLVKVLDAEMKALIEESREKLIATQMTPCAIDRRRGLGW